MPVTAVQSQNKRTTSLNVYPAEFGSSSDLYKRLQTSPAVEKPPLELEA